MHVGDGGGGQDFELNLAPIIDCFTVLITYLLVSASFLSLSIFDVGVAASGQGAPASTTPPHAVIVRLTESHLIELKLSGGKENLSVTLPVPAAAMDWDLANVTKQLEQLKTKYSDINDISLSAENRVTYKEVVRVIESLRKNNPKIYLAS